MSAMIASSSTLLEVSAPQTLAREMHGAESDAATTPSVTIEEGAEDSTAAATTPSVAVVSELFVGSLATYAITEIDKVINKIDANGYAQEHSTGIFPHFFLEGRGHGKCVFS
jgi:hypothetical protein